MERFAEKIATWLIMQEAINKEDKALYQYAVFTLISKILPFLVVIPFCIVTKTVVNGMILVVVFMNVRKYAGGYHAKTPMRCFIFSSIILSIFIWLSKKIRSYYGLWILLLFSVITLNKYSPIESGNKKLEIKEKKKYKKYVQRFIFISILIIIVFTLHGMDEYAVSAALGLILSAILQIGTVVNLKKITKKRT